MTRDYATCDHRDAKPKRATILLYAPCVQRKVRTFEVNKQTRKNKKTRKQEDKKTAVFRCLYCRVVYKICRLASLLASLSLQAHSPPVVLYTPVNLLRIRTS